MSSSAPRPFYSLQGGATALTRGEAQSFARGLLNSQKYRDDLKDRLENRKLAPALEIMLWHYAFGKPVENINLSVVEEDLSTLSIDELREKMDGLAKQLDEAEALANAIPAQVLNGPWSKTQP